MADNCCNPVTPETCVHKCAQLIDACCVINEDELPCIIAPVVINMGVSAGSPAISDLTVSDLLPNPFYGVITVTSPTPNIFSPDTSVTKIVGDVVYLSQLPIGSDKVDVVFTFTEQRQCDINAAIDKKLCQAGGGCPQFQALPTLAADWINSTAPLAGPGEVSNVVGCIVRFRGVLEHTFVKHEDYCASYQFVILAGTLPAPLWPLTYAKALSVNVTIVENESGKNNSVLVPALFTVLPTGVIAIRFYLDSGCVKADNLKLFLSLDGLTYEIV